MAVEIGIVCFEGRRGSKVCCARRKGFGWRLTLGLGLVVIVVFWTTARLVPDVGPARVRH